MIYLLVDYAFLTIHTHLRGQYVTLYLLTLNNCMHVQ